MGNFIPERIIYKDKLNVIHIKKFQDAILPIKSKDSIFLCKFITIKEAPKIAIMLGLCINDIGRCKVDEGSYYLFSICVNKLRPHSPANLNVSGFPATASHNFKLLE